MYDKYKNINQFWLHPVFSGSDRTINNAKPSIFTTIQMWVSNLYNTAFSF